jgi:phage baseplate assembly protein W
MANIQQSGFSFPMIAKGPLGRVNYTRSDTLSLIEFSIIQICTTVPGERLWNPPFGCRVKQLMFESLTSTISETIANLIMEALGIWEPRISVKASDIVTSQSNDINSKIKSLIGYTVINPDFTQQAKNSVLIQF